MIRYCQKCNGEITDLTLHPTARQCKKCRSGYTRNSTLMDLYGAPLREYLDRNSWPTYLIPKNIISDDPTILGDSGYSPRGQVSVIGSCLSLIRGDQGQRYIKCNRMSFRLTFPSEIGTPSMEATA